MIRTSRVGLSELFTNLGIVSGGTVMIHSALFSLGIIEGGIEGFYKQLLKHLGEDGTIVVPTFTSSFRRGEVFDVRYSQSSRDIGVLSEFIRLKTEAVRSADPLFSMAAIGPRAEYLMQRSSASCFGGGLCLRKAFF